MANAESSGSGVSTHVIREDMERAGYTRIATQLALLRLSRMGFLEAFEDTTYNDSFVAYRLLTPGEDWLLANQEKLELRAFQSPKSSTHAVSITDDDVPF